MAVKSTNVEHGTLIRLVEPFQLCTCCGSLTDTAGAEKKKILLISSLPYFLVLKFSSVICNCLFLSPTIGRAFVFLHVCLMEIAYAIEESF